MSLDLVLVLALKEKMRCLSSLIRNLRIILKNVIHLIKHATLFLYYSNDSVRYHTCVLSYL